MKKQGTYPTIYITFENEKHDDFSKLTNRLSIYICVIYKEFYCVFESLKHEQDKELFMRTINRKLSLEELEVSFKRSRKTNKKTVPELIEEAKNQIEEKKYETELLHRGITNIKKLAIVFKGKMYPIG